MRKVAWRTCLHACAGFQASHRGQTTHNASKCCFVSLTGVQCAADGGNPTRRWTAVAGLVGTLGSALAWNYSNTPISCSHEDSQTAKASKHADIKSLRAWLLNNGSELDAIDFRPSPEGAGLGIWLSETPAQIKSWRGWIWGRFRQQQDVILAKFPLHTAITTSFIISQPGVGRVYSELLKSGKCDERMLIQLFLLVEKLRGEGSLLAPWIACLPRSFDTPLHYSEAELAHLQGTTLHSAAKVLSANLQSTWKELEPVCENLLAGLGIKGAQATFADFLWAYSIFWSRAQTFPDPSQQGEAVAQEGIVPGLDFCNHDFAAASHWTVFGARTAGKGQPTGISLVARRRAMPQLGEDITISYGDKSNEELLFLYGFTVNDNGHDLLMLRCPLPPVVDWGKVLRARVALLQQKSLSPQLFLPASGLSSPQLAKAGEGKAVQMLQEALPQAAWDTLEVLVMEPSQLAQELEAGKESTEQEPTELCASAESSGLRLAVMTTLMRLLEVKLAELEGAGGTGPLEEDVRLLEGPLSTPGGEWTGRLRSCVVYRAGQKHIARSYLQLVRLAVMEQLQGKQQLSSSAGGQ